MSRGLQRGPVFDPRQESQDKSEPMHPVAAAPAVLFQRTNTCSMEQPSLCCVRRACAFDRDTTTDVYFFFGAPKT
jgi:hypothetical protein